jgi:hypothetical protein
VRGNGGMEMSQYLTIKEFIEGLGLGYVVKIEGFYYNSAIISIYDAEGKMIAQETFGQ